MSDNPYRLPRQIIPSHYDLRLEPDLKTFAFAGKVTIAITVVEPIDSISFNSAELDLKSFDLRGSTGDIPIRDISFDEEYERAILAMEERLKPGDYTLTISYSGSINDELRGLYRSVFEDADGLEHVIATSQCQATDARRVFPCWDEPDFKATFQTTMVVADGLEAYSNTAEVSRKTGADGRIEFVFAPTMKMSTYLLAFIVGEFEATEPVMAHGTPTRIIVPKGNLHLTQYALREAVWCLEYLSDYYGIPYPGDKLDHIAIPDFSAGAMENVGLITYRDSYLIIDTDRATQAELERSLEVIAHEIAHQWFGNLVTLRWWEGAWLNEAFATFMEEKAVDVRRPQWNRLLSFQLGNKAWAHGTDHLATTRTIEFEVQSPAEVDEMFDAITYGKGAAVLRQIEQFIGEDVFRRGIGNYLRKHSYSNTDTNDLWEGLDAASEWPVGEIMGTWVYQKGLPQIDVEKNEGGYRLSQRRFLLIPDDTDTTLWQVPLMIKGSANGVSFAQKVLLETAEESVDVEGALDYVFVNAGANGFYRVRYSDDLAASLLENIDALEAIERFTLVNDARALMESSQVTADAYLDLVSSFGDESEYAVWAEILGGLSHLEHHTMTPQAVEGFRAFVASLVRPALERIGWEARPGDPDLTRKLRGSLIGAMGTLADDPTAIDRARTLVRDLIAGTPVDQEVAVSALGVVADHADRSDFDILWQAYQDATLSADEVRYLRAAARANFEEAGQILVDRIVDGQIRTQNINLVVVLMLTTDHGDKAWASLRTRWSEVMAVIPPFTRRWSIGGVSALSKPETANDVKVFFAETGFPEAPRFLDQRLEMLTANVRLRERETPVVADYFK